MDQKLRVALVGVGAVGKIHAVNIARNIRGTELVLAVDAFQGQAEEYLRSVGLSEVPVSDTVEDVWRAGVDAVLLCSPSDTHAKYIEAAVKAGIRNIFCEKPIDYDVGRTLKVLELVREKDVRLQMGFHRRFDVNHRALYEQIRAGRLGKLFLVRISSRSPQTPPPQYFSGRNGGLFFDTTTHDFDMARYVTGSEIEEVFARSAHLGSWSYQTIDPEEPDTAMLQLKMANGALVEIDNCWHACYGHDQRIEVLGEKGMLESLNPPRDHVRFSGAEHIEQNVLFSYYATRYPGAYLAEMEHFADCIRENRPSPVTGEDGLKSLVCSIAAQRSQKTGRAVATAEILSEYMQKQCIKKEAVIK